jgi:hypothetical protein
MPLTKVFLNTKMPLRMYKNSFFVCFQCKIHFHFFTMTDDIFIKGLHRDGKGSPFPTCVM